MAQIKMIVECFLCQDLCKLLSWNKSDLYICDICAKILMEIRQENLRLEKCGLKPLEWLSRVYFEMKRKSIDINKS